MIQAEKPIVGRVTYLCDQTDYSTDDKERNVELADHLNEKLGVDMWQRQAMEVGSICGWDVPGADPAKYQERLGSEMGGMTLG